MSYRFGVGAADRVNLGSGATLDNPADVTVAALVYPTATGLAGGIMAKGTAAGANRRSLEFANGGAGTNANSFLFTVDLSTTDSTVNSGTGTVLFRRWQWIVATYNDTSKVSTLYHGLFGGKLSVLATGSAGSGSTGDNSANDQFYGVFGAGTSGSVAHLADKAFMCKNVALSLAEAQAATDRPDLSVRGRTLHVEFGAFSSSYVPDLSGNGNHGTVVGATWSRETATPFRRDSRIAFEPPAVTSRPADLLLLGVG